MLGKYNQYKEATEFADACYGTDAAQIFSEQASSFEAAKAKLRLKLPRFNEVAGAGDTDYVCHRTKGEAPNIGDVRRYARYLLDEFENAVKE